MNNWSAVRLVLAVALVACDPGPITSSNRVTPPPDSTVGSGGGGAVQRGTLTVTVTLDPGDAAIASAVGIAPSGLTVRLTRTASSDPPRSAVTDADGRVQFEGLLQGNYQVSVDRRLTPAEIALLPADARDASVFAGGAAVRVSPPAGTATFSLVASRRGSLVISEVFIYYAYVPVVGAYGTYVELYNNSDTTIYLDGMLLFDTWPGLHQEPRCTDNEHFRMDSTGVWARWIHRFPGSGTQYPIRPGEAKVVATDAVDHSLLDPGMQDLRGAHFEFIGNSADPDNPFAANMHDVVSGFGGHGFRWLNDNVTGVALPIASDTTQLERGVLVTTMLAQTVFKIPRNAILDATAHAMDPTFPLSGNECAPMTAPMFDAAASQISHPDRPLAIRRRSLGFSATGAEILQRTRNSARDFETAPPLQRSLKRR